MGTDPQDVRRAGGIVPSIMGRSSDPRFASRAVALVLCVALVAWAAIATAAVVST